MNLVLKKIGMLAVTLLTSLYASAYDFDSGGIYYNITDPTAKEVEVTYKDENYGTYSGEITVPSTVSYNDEEYTVTAIGNETFFWCSNLASITLPNTVTTLGERAFANCSGLTSIMLPNSMTTIKASAFYSCDELISITLSNSLTTIGNGAFCGCSSLTSITLPSTLTTIGENAFGDCGLTSITSLAVTPPVFTEYQFSGIDLQSCTLYVPAESIEAYKQAPVWQDFGLIAEIGTVKNFEVNGIYYNVTNVTAKEVEVIKGENAYSGEIDVPSTVSYDDTQYTVTAIGEGAFNGCDLLTSITLPSSLTTIGVGAFFYCSSLTSITLPSSLTTLGEDTFAGCSKLTSITSLAVTPPVCGEYTFNEVDTQNCALYVPEGCVDAYKQAPVWRNFAFIKEIGSVKSFMVDGIYYNVTNSTTKEVEVIKGENAYGGEIVVPSTVSYENEQYTVTAIADYVFHECFRLTSITLPNSLTTIGDHTFASCWSLTSITSQAVNPPVCAENSFNGVDTQNCTLYVPAESVDAYKQAQVWRDFAYIEEIGAVRSFEVDGIYYNVIDPATKAVEVVKGENEYSGDIVVPTTVTYNDKQYTVTAIGDRAFINCSSLTSIILPNSLTTIGDNLFSSCSSLTSIILPNSLTTIGNFTFERCTSLASITLPNTLTAIGNGAFAGCGSLTSITLPSSLTTIGSEAFSSCTSLTSITSLAVNPPVCGNENTFNSVDKQKCAVFVTAGCIEAYTKAPVWNGFAFIAEIGTVKNFEVDGIYYNVIDPATKAVEVVKGENEYSGDIVVPATVTYNDKHYTVTAIGNEAFFNCTDLTSITLPNSLTTIGEQTFAYCYSLTSITSLAVNPPVCAENSFNGVDTQICAIYVPAESVDAYKQAPVWMEFGFIAEIGTARSFEVDGIYYNVIDPATKAVEVVKGENEYSGDIVVPATVTYNDKQYTVTAIGNEAFLNCTDLTSITLPNSLTTIGNYTFDSCSSLVSITLPSSLTTIGNFTFSSCTSLASITLPSTLTAIADGAFYDCGSLTSITLPNSLTTIGDYAFAGCGSLTSITLPSSLTTIGSEAFSWCSSLTSITSLAVNPPVCGNENTFDSVDKQKCSVFVPAESVDAYRHAPVWKDFAYIDEVGTVRSFEVDGIYYNITDPAAKEVEVIKGENKYSGDIVVPPTVTYNDEQYTVTAIADGAFFCCYDLTSITLPNSLTTIGDYAFADCYNLASITSSAVTPPVCAGYTFEGVDKQNCTLYVPAESLDAYKQAQVWRDFAYIEEIGAVRSFEVDGIYYNITDKTNKEVEVTKGENEYTGDIVVPESVTYNDKQYTVTAIGDMAFFECYNLTSITLPNSLTAIGNGAFLDCADLTSITLPNSLTTIGEQTFAYCYGLTSITLPNSLTAIGNGAFAGCGSLTSITLPSSLTTIGEQTFAYCYGLTSITSLAINPPVCGNENTFNSVDKQKCSVFVPAESVDAYRHAPVWKDFAYIDEVGAVRSFEVDGIYYNITDPAANEVEVVKGENEYTGDITVPATVTYNDKQYTVTAIGYRAFAVCSGLTTITLPNTVTAIGDGAFAGCSGLTSITSLATVPPVCAENSFEGVDMQNCTLYVPAGSVDAYKQADGWKNFLLIKEIGAEDKETFEVDGIYYNITDPAAKKVEVIKGESAYTGDITVPATVTYNDEQYTVAAIGDGAFAGCSGLTSITSLATVPPVCAENSFEGVDMQNCTLYVPAGSVDAYKQADGWKNFPIIKEIGGEEADADSFEVDGIYYNVTDKAAKKVEVIKGESAYTGDIVVPESVTYNDKQYTVTAIADKSFLECGDLKSVILPKTVTEIRDYTFYGCDSLATVTLPEAVTTIGKQAFAGCFCLSSIAIPGTVTSIGDEAFANCSGLTSIDVDADNQVYSSVDGILYDKAQTSLILCPAGIKGDVLIPNTVTTICDHALAGCSGLTSVTLPEAVTTIGDYAFSYCYSLTTITLPASVTTVGKNAFAGCSNLTSVTSLATVPPVCGTYAFDGVSMEDCTLYVPAESVDAYKQAPVWKEFGLIEDNSSLGIGSIDADTNEDVEVFSINGAKVSDTLKNLPAGIYIVRNGSTVRKVVVR